MTGIGHCAQGLR